MRTSWRVRGWRIVSSPSVYAHRFLRATTPIRTLLFFNLLSIPPRRSASTAFPSIQPFIFCALRYMIVTLIALVYPSLCYSSLASFVAANSSPPFRSLSLPFPCFSMTSFPYVDPSIPHASPFNIHDRMSYVPQLLRSFSPKSAVLPHRRISVSAPRSSGAPMYPESGPQGRLYLFVKRQTFKLLSTRKAPLLRSYIYVPPAVFPTASDPYGNRLPICCDAARRLVTVS